VDYALESSRDVPKCAMEHSEEDQVHMGEYIAMGHPVVGDEC
jgi:hypothetical protein